MLTRVQSAYLLYAAQRVYRRYPHAPAPIAELATTAPDLWSEDTVSQAIRVLHDQPAAVAAAGVDSRRLPTPPSPIPVPQTSTASVVQAAPPACASDLAVPTDIQLRSSRDILTADLPPIVFDGTIDSLRAVPVSDLTPHVSSTVVERLTAAGVDTVHKLLMRIPRTYIDRSQLTALADVRAGMSATFVGRVLGITSNREKRWVKIRVGDATNRITCTFFNSMWIATRFADRDVVIVQGEVGEWLGAPTMNAPTIERLDDSSSILIPIYPQSTIKDLASGKRDKQLTTDMLREAATVALQRISSMHDPIPAELIERRQLLARLDAMRAVHIPDGSSHAAAGRARMAYDELLRLQLALGVIRNAQAARPGVTHAPNGILFTAWLDGLPYALTGAQQHALADIRAGLCARTPMNRLLQGDVGAGKTNVMLGAALMAIEGGYQTALLAPTEILARQHFTEIAAALRPLGLRVDLLVQKQLPRPRKQMLADLAAGATNLVVGTHALLTEQVQFANLGLAMIDEQHRFGVDQRAQLAAKGARGAIPDILQATATPIPRTAAITTYGDMDITVLDEKPAGRTDVDTHWISAARLDDPTAAPWANIRHDVAHGRQAFVVCSRVDGAGHQSETKAAAAATDAAAILAETVFPNLKVAVAHGKQHPEERRQVMDAYTAGEIDVLVATTVIEVGVSVPNATVMVVLDANKFGLAQLHQIRGRVGRGQHPGRCWLVADSPSGDAAARMQAMTSTNDGFALSELDLTIRGVGSLTGTEQSGHDAGLYVADLIGDARIHLAARADAQHILAADPDLRRHLTLKREVDLALGSNADYLTRG